MSALAHRTLRSNVRLNPYDAGQGQFLDFHSTVATYYPPPLTQSFTDEFHTTTDLSFLFFDKSASSPESVYSIDSPLGTLPSTPAAADADDAPSPPTKSTASRRGRSANYVPRPRNAFMIFRSEFWAKQKISKTVEVDHRHISRIVGILWNELSEDEKRVFRVKADLEKLEHQKLYPTYRFTPTVRAQKPVKRKVRRNGAKDLNRCREVAGLLMAGKQGDELEKAVLDLDKEAESRPAPLADALLPSNACRSPDVRGWVPENGISERVFVPGPIATPQLDSSILFNYHPNFPPDTLAVPPPPPQFAPNYSSSLPPDYAPSPPSLWDVDPNACFEFPVVFPQGPPPSVSIEPYDQVIDRPMVIAMPYL